MINLINQKLVNSDNSYIQSNCLGMFFGKSIEKRNPSFPIKSTCKCNLLKIRYGFFQGNQLIGINIPIIKLLNFVFCKYSKICELWVQIIGKLRMQNDISEQSVIAEGLIASGQIIADDRILRRQLDMLSLTIDDEKHVLRDIQKIYN